ncbi:MAG: heme o synthase [Candidatus Nanopelagicales bacterium]
MTTPARAPARPPRQAPARWRLYLALTKPRVIELLLVTTLPVMFLAAEGVPHLATMLITLVGGSLAAGGANAINQVYDRDIDAKMSRTSQRPIVTGQVTPSAAMGFGVTLAIMSVLLLGFWVNVLSAVLAAAAISFYVFIYTMLLKRRTAQNIVWGGAAGCFPVLIGWAAVTGSLTWTPFILFLVVFFWTPPHYWPLALKFRADYEAARVPMLPVVTDARRVATEIILYSWAMVAASLVLIPVAQMGWVYTIAATVLGGYFLLESYGLLRRVKRDEPNLQAMRLFHGSISYLSLLFLAVALEPFLF